VILQPPNIAIIDGQPDDLLVQIEPLARAGAEVDVFKSLDQLPPVIKHYDCLVIDLTLVDWSDVQAKLSISANSLHVSIIGTMRQPVVSQIVAAMKHGALAVLHNPTELSGLRALVEEALRSSALRQREEVNRRRFIERLKLLTPREAQVFQLIVAGFHVKQVGLELGIGIKTVHTFRSQLFQKLRVESNTDIVLQVALLFGRRGLESMGNPHAERTLEELIALA